MTPLYCPIHDEPWEWCPCEQRPLGTMASEFADHPILTQEWLHGGAWKIESVEDDVNG